MFRLSTLPFLLCALIATGCSSNSTIEEEDVIAPDATPMRFSTPSAGSMETRGTRADALQSDFLVSAYKRYGEAGEQTVMNQYQALYSAIGWSTTQSSWDYVSSSTNQPYQTQNEKYWDLSAFPYEFIAIAPAPVENGSAKSGFEATKNKVEVTAPYVSQSAADGSIAPYAPATEYLVAEMRRKRTATDATKTADTDIATNTTIGTGSDAPTKAVPLPFHHLSAKVRFAIYTTEPNTDGQSIEIRNVSFRAESDNSNGFTTSATGYTANLTPTTTVLDGSFSGTTYTADSRTLLTFSAPTETQFTDAYLEKHEWKSKTDVNAYFFECKDGLLQVPQSGVRLYVTFTLKPTIGDEVTYTDVPLTVENEDGSTTSVYNWKPNTLYTYYIIVGRSIHHDISFTATLNQWEDVDGEIDTNLEQ